VSAPFDAERYLDAVAPAVGVPVPEHCRPGVKANLERLAAMAESLLAFEPEPVEHDPGA
jgi:hypothetical protein